jgi:hypothetical protein
MAKGIGRNGELFRTLCDRAHLMRCARAAARGKKRKPDAAAFLLNMEPECFRLADALSAGTWMPGTYRSYVIREPKPRLISAAPFADRVVHHALVSLLEPHFERRFVAHSFACRVGKGTHRALARATELSGRRRFVLKGDIAKFFPSIDHQILKAQVRRVVDDERLLAVLERIVDGSNPQEPVTEWFEGDDLFAPAVRRRGIPIGNLTSQFLAELRLRLHARKGGVHATRSAVPFLGFVVRDGRRRLRRAAVVRAGVSAAELRGRVRAALVRSTTNRVIRGGSWNNDTNNVRSSNRNNDTPGNTNNNIGFRVASTP